MTCHRIRRMVGLTRIKLPTRRMPCGRVALTQRKLEELHLTPLWTLLDMEGSRHAWEAVGSLARQRCTGSHLKRCSSEPLPHPGLREEGEETRISGTLPSAPRAATDCFRGCMGTVQIDDADNNYNKAPGPTPRRCARTFRLGVVAPERMGV